MIQNSRKKQCQQNRYIGVNVCDLKESLSKTIYLPYAVTSNNHKFISPETEMFGVSNRAT